MLFYASTHSITSAFDYFVFGDRPFGSLFIPLRFGEPWKVVQRVNYRGIYDVLEVVED